MIADSFLYHKNEGEIKTNESDRRELQIKCTIQ